MNTFQTIVSRFGWKQLSDVDRLSRKIKLLGVANRPAWGWPPEGVEREGKPAATPMKMWPLRPLCKSVAVATSEAIGCDIWVQAGIYLPLLKFVLKNHALVNSSLHNGNHINN